MTLKTINTEIVTQDMVAAASSAVGIYSGIAAAMEAAPAVESSKFDGQIPMDECEGLELAAWEGDDGNVYSIADIAALGASEDAALVLTPLYRAVIKAAAVGEPVGMVVHPASAAPTEFKLAWFVNIEELPPNTKFYIHPQPSLAEKIDPELRKKVLELCDQIDAYTHTWALQTDAKTIREMLGSDK